LVVFLVAQRFLVTEVGLNVNVHDEWQASPLYYASLCGHLEAVVFLLTAGVFVDVFVISFLSCFSSSATQFVLLFCACPPSAPHLKFKAGVSSKSDRTSAHQQQQEQCAFTFLFFFPPR